MLAVRKRCGVVVRKLELWLTTPQSGEKFLIHLGLRSPCCGKQEIQTRVSDNLRIFIKENLEHKISSVQIYD